MTFLQLHSFLEYAEVYRHTGYTTLWRGD